MSLEINKPEVLTYYIEIPSHNYGSVDTNQVLTSGQESLEQFTDKANWMIRLNELGIENDEILD